MNDKTLLITGGTGSFGNAVLRFFLQSEEIQEIRSFSRDEKKQDDLRKKLNNSKVKFYIGDDVRDYRSVENVIHGVDYVFHAAALKQVPSCEFFPIQAVKTNILGAENVRRHLISEGLPHSRIYLTGSPMCEVLEYNKPGIDRSEILNTLKLKPSEYFIVSTHREENVDNEENLVQILIILNHLADKYSLPVIVSTHPRTRKRIETLEKY